MRVMKKNYNEPELEVSEIVPQSIICASFTDGGDAPGDTIGD